RKASNTNLWLEIFIVPGINDSANAINSFCACLPKIKPDKIQLNSLDRPGTESWVQKADLNSMIKIKNAFSPYAPTVEIISRYSIPTPSECKEQTNSQIESEIFSLISRRPCTVDDISLGLKIDRSLATEILSRLEKSGRITAENMPTGKFFYLR
ncbi:MAG: radical SAM protein, partial [Candidatus Nanoarchaeia archaeon]